MTQLTNRSFAFGLGAIILMLVAESANAQQQGLTVQLPVVNRFNVNTVVMVPDGGMMSLGGVSRHAEGRISQGIPGLSGPLSRPFSNRASGYSTSGSHAAVKVQIISLREMDEDLTAALRANRPANYEEVQARKRKADFLTRNIGRNLHQ